MKANKNMLIGSSKKDSLVTSPTGIRELERASGVRIAEQILDAIASKLA
jgi:hypothetical protein